MQLGEKHTDTFNPSAVYRKTGTNAFALEGIRHDKRETFHAFLMIDNYILEAVQLQTNETLSITDLRKMYAQVLYNGQRTVRKMPTGYEKVANLPNDNFSIEIEEHLNAGNWLILLLPPAFVIDVGMTHFARYHLDCDIRRKLVVSGTRVGEG